MKTLLQTQRLLLAGLALTLLTPLSPLPSNLFAQGSLTPPGPPAPTMKTLSQIEPRTPIASVPFTISEPGSYYLTTNLVGTASASGITIGSGDVTLDLNGFALKCVSGSFHGIVVGTVLTNIIVRNGIACNDGCVITACMATANGGDGIVAPNSSHEYRCSRLRR